VSSKSKITAGRLPDFGGLVGDDLTRGGREHAKGCEELTHGKKHIEAS